MLSEKEKKAAAAKKRNNRKKRIIDTFCLVMAAMIVALFLTIFIVPKPGVEVELIFAAGVLFNAGMTVRSYRNVQKRYVIFLAIAIALAVAFVRLMRG